MKIDNNKHALITAYNAMLYVARQELPQEIEDKHEKLFDTLQNEDNDEYDVADMIDNLDNFYNAIKQLPDFNDNN